MKFHGFTEATCPFDFAAVVRHPVQGKVRQCRSSRAASSGCARKHCGAGGHERLRDIEARCGCFVQDSQWRHFSQFSVDRFREKIESYADGCRDGGPTRATIVLSLRTRERTARPTDPPVALRVRGVMPPGLDIGAADQEVEVVGSRRVPFVVQSEQDKMLWYHGSLLTHGLDDGLDLCLEYQVSRVPLDVWPRVKAKDQPGVLQQLKTWVL